MDLSGFWTIATLAFIVGVAAVIGLVGYYWFVVVPRRLEERDAGPDAPSGRPTVGS
jgi:hypothetical protein